MESDMFTNRVRHLVNPWRPLSAHDKIDVCRGLFAFLVVSAHSLEVAWTIRSDALPGLPAGFRTLLEYGAGTGIYWVMGFFLISGYCVSLSAGRLVEGNTFPLKSYLAARLTRIAPLYYIALLFAVLVEWWIAADRPTCWPNGVNSAVFLYQLLFVQNFAETFGSFAPSWSITNEVVYYVLYGVIVFVATRRRVRPAAAGMLLCLTIGGLTHFVYRLGYKSHGLMQFGLLFGLGVNWFLGALIAERGDYLLGNSMVQTCSRYWPLALIASIGMWCSQRVHLEFVYVGSGIAFALMLVRFLVIDRTRDGLDDNRRASANTAILSLGLSSYPTYLFHGPILALGAWTVVHWKLDVSWVLIWAALSTAAIISGLALGHVAERPIMAWRAAWLKSCNARPHRAPSQHVDRSLLGIHQTAQS